MNEDPIVRESAEVGSLPKTNTKEEVQATKYIGFTEADLRDADKLIETKKKVAERGERKGWKNLFPLHSMGSGKGFIICEADEEGLIHYALDYNPVLKVKFLPMTQFKKWVELYQKMKE